MTEGADGPGTGPAGRKWTALAAGLLLSAVWLAGHHKGGAAAGAATGTAPRALAAAAGDHPPRLYAPHGPLPAALPEHLDIASIAVHADLVGRGLRDGAVEPPPYDTPGVAGWYRDGPAPGAAGAALVVGHVDTRTGPAVFYGLSTVRAGAEVDVTRADGTVAEFSVEAVEVVQKARFDATRVYGSTGRPELRLITCGGTFDRTARTYSANVVVYAVLTGSRPA
ncbi:class F sortase [Actinacidiphila sp. ITFR-21]|uniref:class F sortase n=1 Tax=Actinacidiphila sp. ITFR-21 TaxID=3075199 RepID=UPI00288A3D86|nr:class F sortase [Streptomyces sp. ITFR-21]WNI15677.1 class F sortase [Streptomyces sp. ITFR-21]